MQSKNPLDAIPDDELLRRLAELLRRSRGTEAELVAHVGEVDARRLYAREASPSMFAYCTEVLHLSESEAYLRIAVARASREHPVLLTMLADGRLHLSAIAKLAPRLTPDNRAALLERATHKSKREVEELIAEIDPRPDLAASMRKLPERRIGTLLRPDRASSAERELRPDRVVSNGMGGTVPSGGETAVGTPADVGDRLEEGRLEEGPLEESRLEEGRPRFAGSSSRSSLIEPLAPARYKVVFTASAELRDKLERLQALMRHSVPDGDLAAIIDTAVSEKLERLEARRFGRTRAPKNQKKRPGSQDVSSPPDRTSPQTANAPVGTDGPVGAAESCRSSKPEIAPGTTRHVPAAVKRAVDEREGGRCRYTNAQGRRCTERRDLEFHHRHPFGFGGGHSVEGISLVCKTHNRYLAEVDYGPKAMARHRRSRRSLLELTTPSR